MNKQFTWIPFYQEFSKKLLTFRNDRKPLLDMIYENRDELRASYLHDEGGENDLLSDVDPFTVFGLFNRQIKSDSRIHSTELFKELLQIHADVPSDFDGKYLTSTFYLTVTYRKFIAKYLIQFIKEQVASRPCTFGVE